MSDPALALFNLPGGLEWILIGGVALLIFGRRLPDVARSIGKSIVEFKRGIRDVKDDIDAESRLDARKPKALEHSDADTQDEDDHEHESADQPISKEKH